MKYDSWSHFAREAHDNWKAGNLSYSQYWLCYSLAVGIAYDHLSEKSKFTPEELAGHVEKIGEVMDIDYFQEVENMWFEENQRLVK